MHSILNIVGGSDVAVYDLTTLQTVIDVLGLDTESDDTADIEAQITFQSQVIASLLGRVLASQDVIETFWTDGSPLTMPLPLRRYPVTQLDSVQIGGSEQDASTYQLDSERGLLWFVSDNVRTGQLANRKVQVTYTGGYILPDEAPAALASAVIELIREQRRRAALSVNSQGADTGTVRATQHGDTRVEYATSNSSTSSSSSSTSGPVPQSVLFLIEPFKAPAL